MSGKRERNAEDVSSVRVYVTSWRRSSWLCLVLLCDCVSIRHRVREHEARRSLPTMFTVYGEADPEVDRRLLRRRGIVRADEYVIKLKHSENVALARPGATRYRPRYHHF